MKASLIYRVAAAVLVLFAIGHTTSFSQTDPSWGLDATLASMRSIRFSLGGTERTYWDLFVAAGLIGGLFYLFSAVLAWQLGSLRPEPLKELWLLRWAFAAAFAGVTSVSIIHLFPIPIAFAAVSTLLLAAGAWAGGR